MLEQMTMVEQAEQDFGGGNDLHEQIILTALRDRRFLHALLRDAKAALREWRFIDIPDDVQVQVHQDRAALVNLVIPYVPDDLPVDSLSDTQLMEAVGIGTMSRTTASEVQTCCSRANCC